MRSSSRLVVSLLILFLLVVAGRCRRRLGTQGGRGRRWVHGGGSAAADSDDSFYEKVGRFAVRVYSLGNDIKPVPKLESVLSASTRPAAEGSGAILEYLLVLRVAGLGTFRALVWGVPTQQGSQDWKLKYFQPVDGA